MEQLSEIMLKKGEPFRARAYQKAQETIISYDKNITSPDELKGLPNIGDTILGKLTEYTNTGTLQILEKEKNNPINILSDVYGIGPKKATELVESGITSISDLRNNQHLLNDIQRVGLNYYEDILERIPRIEIEQYKNVFNNSIAKTPETKIEIVGSYRRGAPTSGDIDVIITSTTGSVFSEFIDNLINLKIILCVLSRGPTKCLVVAKLPNYKTARRVDFLFTTQSEFPFAILYFTGSKIFNTVMRGIAVEKGYTMNEHGLYNFINKKKGDKVNYIFNTEQDIFNFLGLVYKHPTERIDGRAVVKTKLNNPIKSFVIENDCEEQCEISSKIQTENKMIEEFKQKGILYLSNLREEELCKLIRFANNLYYNEQPILTDNQYDILKEYMEKKYPTNQIINEIGTSSVKKNKAQLPYVMGSMSKIKPDTNALDKWKSLYKGSYILSCKLDGVSGLYSTEGSEPKLYTRGSSTIGQDISNLIPYLRLPKNKDIVIRGEFVISKQTFETKYSKTFSNPRNMVAGIINHKQITEPIHDLKFVAYEVIKPICSPLEQLKLLSTLNVDTVLYNEYKEINNDLLSDVLINWRKNYVYDIDGVIVTNNQIYERNYINPEHAFSFKMVLSDQIAEAKVVDVLWSASKDGYLKPRVQIEPIVIGGVQITYATGFNGAFINTNKIGVGATIELIRSGDVIPHIRKVVVSAEHAKMPSVPYKWNNTGIDIMLTDIESDETVREKNITLFFKNIGVEGLGSGNIKRIIEAGYDSIYKIIKMELGDFMKVNGFQTKMAEKIYTGISDKLNSSNLLTIMSASNMFGRGFSDKKLELILQEYPNVLLSNDLPSVKISKILTIKGMAEKTATLFVENIPNFVKFIKEIGLYNKLIDTQVANNMHINKISSPLLGKTVVLSGFRDNNLQQQLIQLGAKIGSSISSKTFALLVKDKDDSTGKINDAKRFGIEILSPVEFINKYI